MGWNGSNNKSESANTNVTGDFALSKRMSTKHILGITAGSSILVCGLVVLLLSAIRSQKTIPDKNPPVVAIKSEGPVVTIDKESSVKESYKTERRRKEEIILRRELVLKMTPEERYNMVLERLRKVPIPERTASNRLFRTSLENKLAAIFTTQLGDPPPVFPPRVSLHDEAFLAEILIADNPILNTDDARQKDKKETVQLAKKELIKFIKDGGEPDEFLQYYQGQLQQAYKQYSDARKSVFETMRKDPAIAGDYIKKVNAMLREKGIKPVNPPQKVLDAFGVVIEDATSPSTQY